VLEADTSESAARLVQRTFRKRFIVRDYPEAGRSSESKKISSLTFGKEAKQLTESIYAGDKRKLCRERPSNSELCTSSAFKRIINRLQRLLQTQQNTSSRRLSDNGACPDSFGGRAFSGCCPAVVAATSGRECQNHISTQHIQSPTSPPSLLISATAYSSRLIHRAQSPDPAQLYAAPLCKESASQ